MSIPVKSLVLLSLTAAAALAEPTTSPKESAPSSFRFSLLPKSFQRNPIADFNIFSTQTAEGKKRGLPTAENPAYYVMHVTAGESRGFNAESFGKHSPKLEQIEKIAVRALRASHYLPASETPAARPSLVIFVHWGAYSNPALGGDEMFDTESNNGSTALELLPLVLGDVAKRKAIIERAELIGGKAFALELNGVLNQEVEQQRTANSSDSARAAALLGSTGETDNGASSLASILSSTSPLAMYLKRSDKISHMVEEVFSSCYYVAISAIDYESVAAKKPVALWRTKLTLNSIGVSLSESIGPLINSGTDYFGRETPAGVVITKRINREGSVKVGEAQVQDYVSPGPSHVTPTPVPTPPPADAKK